MRLFRELLQILVQLCCDLIAVGSKPELSNELVIFKFYYILLNNLLFTVHDAYASMITINRVQNIINMTQLCSMHILLLLIADISSIYIIYGYSAIRRKHIPVFHISYKHYWL